MARVRRYSRAIIAALLGLAAAAFAPAFAEDQGPNAGTDLFDRPVLAIDPGMHLGEVPSLAVDRNGHLAVTGGADKTVRIWSLSDGKLLRTIHVPIGPYYVGYIDAVAVDPAGSTIAAGGLTERLAGGGVIYLFDRESQASIARIPCACQVLNLKFSADGRYLAASTNSGLQIFDREGHWSEVFKDDYGEDSYGATFSGDGRLVTTAFDGGGTVRLYDLHGADTHLIRSIKAPSGVLPFYAAFSPSGELLAVGYEGNTTAVDLLDGHSLKKVGGLTGSDLDHIDSHLSDVAWALDGKTLYIGGFMGQMGNVILAWDLGVRKQWLHSCDFDSRIETSGSNIIISGFSSACLKLIDSFDKVLLTKSLPIANLSKVADTL